MSLYNITVFDPMPGVVSKRHSFEIAESARNGVATLLQ
jgi:hypothetical protein